MKLRNFSINQDLGMQDYGGKDSFRSNKRIDKLKQKMSGIKTSTLRDDKSDTTSVTTANTISGSYKKLGRKRI
jgi:hypothetical protein